MKSILLQPTYIFNDENPLTQTINLTDNYEKIPSQITENKHLPEQFSRYGYPKQLQDDLEPWEIIRLIKQTRIEIAEYAESTIIGSDNKYDKIKAELGMNIIIPKGKIEQLRLEISLIGGTDSEPIIAVDGLPSDLFDDKYLVQGKVTVAVDKLLKFIPVTVNVLNMLPADIELEPWEFNVGRMRDVTIDFSGGLTSQPAWFFQGNGIKNDVRVALTIKKTKNLHKITADVRAAWVYKPGLFRSKKVGSDVKNILIYEQY
ncbi:MAG: hypothetical protein F6K18_08580 [Okeania sp. SIO2C2]|uniref:hypothetical protein n=1 Tax=Okeania sp. SIO2C2 TaxID=2607787 RepID=UPI0013BC871A|nr:hypothetical protein [Okeania sp. SIO2C2]NEP86885.1 hypothetical protein [Okeania sp. SIO2C2]